MVEQKEVKTGVKETVPVSLLNVQCVGSNFIKYYKLLQGKGDLEAEGSEDGESPSDAERKGPVVFEDDVSFLRSLNPKDWKNQDHYAVLGIKWLRHKASEDVIKQAYRAKVLKHHPDKRKAAGEEIRPDDDYFTCISKAWEILGNKEKRRSYDSVDPLFDDSIPSNSENSKNHFFAVFGPVFDRNGRWAERKPIPKLGNAESSREHVDKFYNYWYNFESWREYSYLDEDEKDKGQDRDERRYIDKQNKAARAKLKKEEMARIRSLVDLAYELDPRVVKFRNEDKEKKLAYKKAKQEAAKARQEEEERMQRELVEKAKREKKEAEAEQRRKELEAKQANAAIKKQMKVKKKAIRDLCKAENYFIEQESELVAHMTGVEKVCEMLQLEEMTMLLEKLQIDGRKALVESISAVERKIEEERLAHLQSVQKTKGDANSGKKGTSQWTPDNLQLLIKAVNVFPAGINQRWEVVATFINQHSSPMTDFTAKEVLAKAKDLQHDDFSKNALKEIANKKAFDNFEKEKKLGRVDIGSDVTERFDSPAELQGLSSWTAQEQQLLEQALRTFGVSVPDRWDRIAECVPGRSKKDCMKRYKELVELVRAKKAAQAAAQK